MGNVIHLEECKILKSYHADTKEFVLENGMHYILWHFQIQTDRPILAIRQDLTLMKKEKRAYQLDDLAIPVDHSVKIQRDLPISARRPDLILSNRKKRAYQLDDLAIPIDHRVKI